MSSNHQHKIEIRGFGPSDLIEVLKPGWNKIVGPNGAGKSNVLAALLWALGGEVPVKLRHNTREAYVEIDGVRIKTLSKPMLNIGDLELALRDESPIADVILPDVQDPKRAETKRIEALLRLVDVDVTPDAVSVLVDDDDGALEYLEETEPEIDKLSIVVAADKIRRRVHEIKRKWEARADEAQGRINAMRVEKPEKVVEISVAKAQTDYDDTVGDLRQAEGEWQQRQEREVERDKIKDNLGDRPDPTKYEREIAEHRERHAELVEQETRLRTKLLEIQNEVKSEGIELGRLDDYLQRTRQEAESWDRRKAILDSEITGATAKDVETVRQEVETARGTLSAARATEEYREACQAVEEAQDEREAALKRAVKYEKLATGVTSRLSILLSQAGIERLTVDEGRLMYVHEKGQLEPFTDLSFGQRTDAVIDLLARKKVPHDILILPWQFHAALQPEAREEVGKRFAERGICALTEEPDDQEGLRVENQVVATERSGREVATATGAPTAAETERGTGSRRRSRSRSAK